MNKSFLFVIAFLIIFQVFFSFYYSSEIINQNNSIDQNQVSLEKLKIENQELKKQLANYLSLNQIASVAGQKKYIDLQEKLKIKN